LGLEKGILQIRTLLTSALVVVVVVVVFYLNGGVDVDLFVDVWLTGFVIRL
jgi:hypothetical protein